MGNDLSRDERQAWITEQVLAHNSVLVDELVDALNVSRMTIHRDLDDLEKQGVLQKIRNGATAHPSSVFESDMRFRLKLAMREKEAIANYALRYVESGQAILLDEATTLLPLVAQLADYAPITVITNFLPIIGEMKDVKDVRLIALGGEFLPRFNTFTGLICQQTIERLHADVWFTSTTGISGLDAFHPNPQIANVKQTMLSASTRRYLLVDSSKFNKTALYQVASLHDFDAVITDSNINSDILSKLENAGVSVEIAEVE